MANTHADPFTLLSLSDEHWPEGVYPVPDAVKCFDPANPEPLFSLLSSADPIVRSRGLSVFGWLGSKGFVALDAALDAARDVGITARSGLLDGVLCYSGKLNSTQASRVLLLAGDTSDLVRDKVVAFLGAAKLAAISAAVAQLDAATRAQHDEGLLLLGAKHSNVQALFDRAVSTGGIWSTYAFAALQRIARRGEMHVFPHYAGDDYVAVGSLANTTRIAGNKARLRTPR